MTGRVARCMIWQDPHNLGIVWVSFNRPAVNCGFFPAELNIITMT